MSLQDTLLQDLVSDLPSGVWLRYHLLPGLRQPLAFLTASNTMERSRKKPGHLLPVLFGSLDIIDDGVPENLIL